MGDKEGAKAALYKALEIAPNSEDLLKRKEQLDSA